MSLLFNITFSASKLPIPYKFLHQNSVQVPYFPVQAICTVHKPAPTVILCTTERVHTKKLILSNGLHSTLVREFGFRMVLGQDLQITSVTRGNPQIEHPVQGPPLHTSQQPHCTTRPQATETTSAHRSAHQI
jgi:hypothetical protein